MPTQKTAQPTHTPTPWFVSAVPGSDSIAIDDNDNNEHVATCWSTQHNARANAALIVRAVNAFGLMLNALKSAHQFSCGSWPGECKGQCNIAQAIAKAEGKE